MDGCYLEQKRQTFNRPPRFGYWRSHFALSSRQPGQRLISDPRFQKLAASEAPNEAMQ